MGGIDQGDAALVGRELAARPELRAEENVEDLDRPRDDGGEGEQDENRKETLGHASEANFFTRPYPSQRMSKRAKGLESRRVRMRRCPSRPDFRPVALVPAYQAEATRRRRGPGRSAVRRARRGRRRRLHGRDGRGGGVRRRRGPAPRRERRQGRRAAGRARGGSRRGVRGHARRVPRRGRAARSRRPSPPARGGARRRRVRHRLADGGPGCDPGLPIPDQRDRQPDPDADDRPRDRGCPVGVSGRFDESLCAACG